MLKPKLILKFLAVAVVIYSALCWAYPWVANGYEAMYRAAGGQFLSRFWFWEDGHVAFLDLNSSDLYADLDKATGLSIPRNIQLPSATDKLDTLLVVMNRKVRSPFGLLRISSGLTAYQPTIVTLAIFLAIPFGSWRRRGWGLLAGLILVHCYIAARISLYVLAECFAANKPYALFSPGPFLTDLINRAQTVIHEHPDRSWTIPVLIWFVVAALMGAFAQFRDKEHETGAVAE